jgi:ATP-dependent Clp protease ATP-binding subunit ClpA
VLAQLKKEPGAILFIDEIHTIIGAGSASGGTMDASNLIKPALASGELRCIGSTTFQEYRGIFEKDRALARRFQKIDVVEPSLPKRGDPEGPAGRFEEHHKVEYTLEALQAAVELSVAHQRPLAAGQGHRRHRRGRRAPAPACRRRSAARSTCPKIEEIVARWRAFPPSRCRRRTSDVLRNLDRNLKMVVFGQDEAIDAGVRDQDGALGSGRTRTSRSAVSCSPGPPASARPRSRASSPCSWASS